MHDEEKQNSINDYYNKLYGDKLMEDEERKIGRVKDIKNKLKEEIKAIDSEDKEYKEYYLEEFEQIMKELEEKREDDIVEIFEHDMSAYYVILNQDSLYEELKNEFEIEINCNFKGEHDVDIHIPLYKRLYDLFLDNY